MIKIILLGCFGRMGTAVQKAAALDAQMEIVAGVDIITPAGGVSFPIYTDVEQCQMPADVIIDFMPPSAIADTKKLLKFAAERQIPLILATTALPEDVMEEVRAASEKVGIFVAANLSLGIGLLVNFLNKAAKLLNEAGFDIEIMEKHHNKKLDSPSGTALLLAQSINQALDGKMKIVTDRSHTQVERGKDEIGIHALRGGNIVGEHSVVFAGADEVVEFTHIAGSRDVFATGAMKAAYFMKDKSPGLYGMQDLIESGM